MAIEKNDLEDLLKQAFPTAVVTVGNLKKNDNEHYAISIECGCFDGKSRIEQHRIVQEAVKNADIHALSIKTSTPN